MNLLSTLVRVAEQTEFDPDTVSPGPWGFAAIAALAVLVIFLGFNLVRRMRRSAYRAEAREKIAAELAEAEAARDRGAPVRDPGADATDPADAADTAGTEGGAPTAQG